MRHGPGVAELVVWGKPGPQRLFLDDDETGALQCVAVLAGRNEDRAIFVWLGTPIADRRHIPMVARLDTAHADEVRRNVVGHAASPRAGGISAPLRLWRRRIIGAPVAGSVLPASNHCWADLVPS